MTDDPILPRDRQQILAPEDARDSAQATGDGTSAALLQQVIALERRRIDVADRRTEAALKAIEAGDAADQRQFDYHIEKLRTTTEERKERWRSVLRTIWAVGGALALVATLLLWMLFFGTDDQQETATDLLATALTGLGGAGVLWMLRTLIKRAMNQSRDD